ncbi:beta-ketothiolase BktB [Bisbaumannia pacifica]|uniref:Beta-ketothiolase BktB n=1 Tax=Bisbaumannia pacifica TaxID=77098 RepID=A0ABD4L1Q5_9GAMM|nr:beta-ketothiolase BktB [Halomonas pacifica]MBH8580534.1 beta-ketothiolase BktB [Halomonas pacifica]
MNDVYILSAVRTAIGDFGGALRDIAPCALASAVTTEAIRRAGLPAESLEQCVFGHVLPTEVRDLYLSRVAALEAGMAETSRALNINRLCGSGLQAVISAAQMIQTGDIATAVAGGAESMSRAGYLLGSHRWGKRMGDDSMVDLMTGVLTDPFGHGHMGVTAETIAREWGIDRETQDRFALESHRRAARAIAEGRFESQILPIETHPRKGTRFDRDEHVRLEACEADFSGLRPAFARDGSVTAGNASGLNDGAAALVLADGATLNRRGLTPMARIVAYGHAGVDPGLMGMGPVAAVEQALARAGLGVDDLAVVESNEAFAAQACAVSRALKLPAEIVNPNGGAVALGHPIGATGAILVTKALHELQRTGGRYGLITLCIGGGQGAALIVENLG